MKVGTVSFAVGSGRLVRRAGSVLFDVTGANNELVAGFDSAPSDDDAFEFAKNALAASGLTLAPFAAVRWGDTVDLLAFGDVALHTSTAVAPMISGASSSTWVEHQLAADYVTSEGSIGVWSGAESESGTNLRLGVAACGGFRVDLVPTRSDGRGHEDEPLAPEMHAAALPVPTRTEAEPLEESMTDDLVGFEAVQAIAGDLSTESELAPREVAEVENPASADSMPADSAPADLVPADPVPAVPQLPPDEPVSADQSDFFGSFEPSTDGPHKTEVIAATTKLQSTPSAADASLAESQPADAPKASPTPPDFTDSNVVDIAVDAPPQSMCERGHQNPADSSSCFTCGGEIVKGSGRSSGQPVTGWLVFDDGSEVGVDRTLVIGRKPATFDEDSQAVVVDHPEVSRSHAQVEVQGWAVVLTDLGSRNGTWVSVAGAEPEQLEAGEPRVLEGGATVLLGAPDVTFTYRVDRA